MDIGAIKARIAELEQRKAERNALSGYRDVSYLDYISQGDRSGFDKIEAEEVAYRNMLAQQAQQERMLGLQQTQQDKILAAQQDFTAKENELNRNNALAIASQNKANEIETKKDEYIRGRNKAAYILNYAQQALSQDPNNIQLQKEAQLAKEDFDFYDRKLGGKGYDNIDVQTEQQSDGLTNNQVNDIVKSIVDKKTYTDADRNKLQVLSEYVNDPTIKEQINTILSNKGKTKEDKDRELEDARVSWEKSGRKTNPDPKKYKVKIKDNKPVALVRK